MSTGAQLITVLAMSAIYEMLHDMYDKSNQIEMQLFNVRSKTVKKPVYSTAHCLPK